MTTDSIAEPELETSAVVPPIPETLAEIGVRRSFLEELLLKILYLSGPFTLREWSNLVKLRLSVVEELFTRLRNEKLCEVTGIANGVHKVAMTSQGRSRALELLSLNQYSGPAPVSLESYVRHTRAQSVRNVEVRLASMQRAFAHLVLESNTLARLGTALNSGSSIFLYGPTGAGKTTIAESLPRVLAEDCAWIPFAVEMDGQIITVYDPLIHQSVDQARPEEADPRWVYCRRPAVVIGGELTIEMLDLQFNPVSKFYTAPAQMKANGGVLIIDDFGRQRVRPEALLNRWIVPLDRRIDFLTLIGGKKIEIPFELFVVFATNMEPSELADEAFLRRIQTKIRVDMATPEQFREIFERVCSERGVAHDPGIIDEFIEMLQDRLEQPLRPCYPRDLVNQVCWAARYEGKTPYVDHEALMRAVRAYFLPAA